MSNDPLDLFGPATQGWFRRSFHGPTGVQRAGWPVIASGAHSLLLAPTGSGKTLAAFLWCIDQLVQRPVPPPRKKGEDPTEPPGVRVVYVSPLKALVYDIERNLRAPLVGLERAAAVAGVPFRGVHISIRTGDTPQRDRARFLRHPGDVLVTTPESLFLLLAGKSAENLRTVHTVIVDEIHAVAGTKRGVHMALTLERLAAHTDAEPQRIGLSATQRPLSEIARFLGSGRDVEIVDASAPPRMDLQIVVPVVDMEAPVTPPQVLARDAELAENPVVQGPVGNRGPDAAAGQGASLAMDRTGIWPAIHPRILALIRAHRSTIIFTNSRRLCERLAARLNELAGEELVRAHHGSISRAQRTEVEEALKAGRLPALVATSSLELGIDMGAVDLVIQVESPGAVARGLQRIGRAGHGVGEVSIGRIFPKYRGDLLEAAVVVRRMLDGDIEPTTVPSNCLDVLSQQLCAMAASADWQVEDMFALVRRTAPYQDLPRSSFMGVLEMLCGRYPKSATRPEDEALFADLRPRLSWDRTTDLISARRGTKGVVVANAGTIPDRGLFGVYIGESGPRIGELDEEMVYESRKGDVFLLGASSWKVQDIKRDRVIVSPAPGEPGRMPFWRGEGPGRPVDLGRSMGALVRQVGEALVDVPRGALQPDGDADADIGSAVAWLAEYAHLDPLAARNLLAFVDAQREATGALPTDRSITVERFRDELGDWRICVLCPFGSRINTPWALALEAALSERGGFDVHAVASDDGIVLRIADADEPPDLDFWGLGALVVDPDELEDLVVSQLRNSGVFAARFRENAARALLLARRRPGERTPLWAQRLRSQNLLAVVGQFPDFPIVLETYREVLQDVFDLPGLAELLGRIQRREVRVDHVETTSASPFSRSLVFRYVATWMYEGDAPLAERRAQALSLDRGLLRELMGGEELRDLLDPDVLTEVEAELQGLAAHRQARDADELADRLRRVGDLTQAEAAARCVDPAGPWLQQLRDQRRAVVVRIAGQERWIAAEDAGRYRDALGVVPPQGLPLEFLAPTDPADLAGPLEAIVLRFARTRAPFTDAELAARYGLPVAQVAVVLQALGARDALLQGEFRPSGWTSVLPRGPLPVEHSPREWVDSAVLTRIRRRTLARLRDQIAPVEAEALARFLPRWHGLPEPGARGRGGEGRLYDALLQLEGLPLPFSELEGTVLPARVPGYRPAMLDELGLSGEIVWVGHGALGSRDGKVALYRREGVAELLSPPAWPPDETGPALPADPLHAVIMDHLAARGASFLHELVRACAAASGAPATTKDVESALWQLVWAGYLTNDTLLPLRGLGRRRKSQRGRGAAGNLRRLGRPGSGRGASTAGGRWSRVADLLGAPVAPTVTAHARAVMLLERYGVVSREAAATEGLPGGFSAVYGVLKALEEGGKVRRGWFVDGPDGLQFALAGAVDALRTVRDSAAEAGHAAPPCRVLAAVDPAQPYGALLPFPQTGTTPEGPRPRRVAGARVVLHDGRPVLYVEPSGKGVLSFHAATEPTVLALAVQALSAALLQSRAGSLKVAKLDGGPALQAARLDQMLAAGFERDHAGLVLGVAV